ncbi:MAG: DUF805 domain-containing protein [Halocynthiibacter sp.]
MGFMDAVKMCFSKYVDFEGRAQRSEYWWFALFSLLGALVFSVLDAGLGIFALEPLFSLGILLPSIAVGVRRLHDIDRTGWWLLIGLVPLIGFLVLIYFFVNKGTDGPNRFGNDPLA